MTAGSLHLTNIFSSLPGAAILTEDSDLVDDETIDDVVVVQEENVEIIGGEELDEKVEIFDDRYIEVGARESTGVASG